MLRPSRRPSAFVVVLALYAAAMATAFVTAATWLEELAAFMLVSLVLWPALRRRSVIASIAWLVAAVLIAALALCGHGDITIDFMPVAVNAALCALFARTLARARTPLIALAIGAIEGPARLALPGVADYARRLTAAWAILLGAQAIALAVLVVCAVPDGLLAAFGHAPPFAVGGSGWRWFLHLGSYLGVIAFIVIEYAYRRWHLRHIPHASLATFLRNLALRWPALARSVVEDRPAQDAA